MKHILVTGGAGFIGSNFVRHWPECEEAPIVNLDKLTYAGNLMNLRDASSDEHHKIGVREDKRSNGLCLPGA